MMKLLCIAVLLASGMACSRTVDQSPSNEDPTDGRVPGDEGTAVPRDELVIITGEGEPPGPDEYAAVPVTRERAFVCLDPGAGSEVLIAEIAGLAGGQIVIVSQGDCQFNLVYRGPNGDQPLSAEPGGYILAEATYVEDTATTVVCASNSHHVANGEERRVDTVAIECWGQTGAGDFAVLPDAVPSSPDYAAWVDAIAPHESDAGVFVLSWIHDFSFQFLNVSDEGRPETDGTYSTRLNFDGSVLSVLSTAQESPSVIGDAPEIGEWIPTDEERQLADGMFDIGPGECPNGCLP